MGKYDDAVVDELIEHVKAMFTPFPISKIKQHNDTQWDPADYSNYTEDKSKAKELIERLQPKPEMEYVLPDFATYKAMHGTRYDGYVVCGDWNFCETAWNAIREATRVPAKPKQGHVPAGEDWSESDLLELNRALLLNTSDHHKDAMAAIDHIKQKCGV